MIGLFGAKKAVLVAGFLGALVSLRYIKPTGFVDGVFYVLYGWFIAIQTTPSIASWQGLSAPVEQGVSFVLGIFGVSLMSSVTDAIRETKLAVIVGDVFRKWSGAEKKSD